MKKRILILVLAGLLFGCTHGGGKGSAESAADGSNNNLTAPGNGNGNGGIIAIAPAPTTVSACTPGTGTDYQVGPNPGQLAEINQVPWESLQAGDTVRIFYRAMPYLGKFLIAGKGTAAAPIRVCGVAGPNGELPVVDGANAVTRTQIPYSNDLNPNGGLLHQTRSVIVIKPLANDDWRYFPEHIQIDGLEIRGARPGNKFIDTSGTQQDYDDFGACIWVERGHNITIANNDIHDCTNGIFSKMTDDAIAENNPTEFSVTKDIRIAGNRIYGNGVVGNDHQHNLYVQSLNVVYEFNHIGPLRAGANGSALKDRSINSVIRYNRIEGGARSLDLVEAEDSPQTALAHASYHTTFVYGNQIIKDATTGTAIHYGGDHSTGNCDPAANGIWGESVFRKGTLYFFNNTVVLTGNDLMMYVFQLSTNEETAEVWNNIFVFPDAAGSNKGSLRGGQEVASCYTTGGVINLGKNWISGTPGTPLQLNDQYHPVPDVDPNHPVGPFTPAPVIGDTNVIMGTVPPIDMNTLMPLAGSAVIDAGQAPPAAAAGFVVDQQLTSALVSQPRTVNGAAIDIGAVER